MALWTVTDMDVVGGANGTRTVRVQLSDASSVVNGEMTLAEAADARRQIERLLTSNPPATSVQVKLDGELYQIDGGSARLFLAKLAPNRSWLLSKSFPPIVVIGIMLLLLAGWGASYLMFRSSLSASNVEIAKLAAQIIQSPRTHPGLLDWAFDTLAKATDTTISPERRQQMLQVLTANPETSFETIVEIYGGELPEFKLLGGRLETYEFWRETDPDPDDASRGGSVEQTRKPDNQQPPASAKEIIDRIPEEKDGASTPGSGITKQ